MEPNLVAQVLDLVTRNTATAFGVPLAALVPDPEAGGGGGDGDGAAGSEPMEIDTEEEEAEKEPEVGDAG